jgi:arylsulfatase A-like enzyme
LDVLGYTLPAAKRRPYDGVSLIPLIEGKMSQRSSPIGFQGHGMATLNDNRFKLVHNPGMKRLKSDNGRAPVMEWELYDLENDPSESKNIIDEHATIAAKMRKQLEEWQESCDASNRGEDY